MKKAVWNKPNSLFLFNNQNDSLFIIIVVILGIEVNDHPTVAVDTFEILFRTNNQLVKLTLTCTGRNLVTTDNVFLQTFQTIQLTVDSCLIQDFRCLLEGSC